MDFYLSALIQGSAFAGLALGIYLSMKIFNIPDITTDGSFTLGAALSSVLLSMQWPLYVVLLMVLAAGALAGACTGLIHTKLKVNPLLAGILVMTALYSVNLGIMGRSNIPVLAFDNLYQQFILFKNENLNTLWFLLLATLLLIALLSYILKSDYGLTMRATGMSDKMVQAMGVNTDRVKIIGLAMSNALTALSGFCIAQYQGFADINMGIGIVIAGLGSVIIAETFIRWFKLQRVLPILLLVCLGAVIFQQVIALVLSSGVNPTYLKLTTAAFVLFIVSMPRWRSSV